VGRVPGLPVGLDGAGTSVGEDGSTLEGKVNVHGDKDWALTCPSMAAKSRKTGTHRSGPLEYL
jgi:hypothetical protein